MLEKKKKNKEEKKNKLKENIKLLENLSKNFEKSFDELKVLLEKINEDKEKYKINIQKKFTEIRNCLNEKEAKFIEDNLMKQIKKETDEEKLTAHENAIQKEKDRLYNIALQKALDKRKADKEEKEKYLEQKEKDEKKNCTFKPKINANAQYKNNLIPIPNPQSPIPNPQSPSF